MQTAATVLIADDDPGILTSLRLLLNHNGWQVQQATRPTEVLFLLKQHPVDLVLMDMNFQQDTTSGREGIDLLGQIRAFDEQLPVVVMTGWATVDLAVQAMQAGAADFVQKPWENQRLLNVLNNQLKLASSEKQQQKLARENQILKGERNQPLIAASASMQQLLQQARQVANSEASVLITGANGTGKTLLAEYIHQHSARAAKPFIAVNMGAISASLFESELFGHVKGAFTDAKQARMGRVELAEGGSLFLDEIGNLAAEQQAKLLYLLEQKQFEKVGASHSQTADIRVLSATNADLAAMLESKTFRADLLYRLNTVHLHLPSLAERREDILPMAEAFLRRLCEQQQRPPPQFSGNAIKALEDYYWPGNVRELSHVVERALLFSRNATIGADELMLQDKNNEAVATSQPQTSLQSLESIEKQTIVQRLAHFDGNANLAAESLGLSRSAFYRRLDKYQLTT